MTRENNAESGCLTHDHDSMVTNKQERAQHNEANLTTTTNGPSQENEQVASARSTIAILRRHPMYDSLILVKKYRACLNGHTLEFPSSDRVQTGVQYPESDEKSCCRTKLVSVYLDGDDPIYQCQEKRNPNALQAHQDDLVFVPMNGLIDRLEIYNRHGVSIDSRVYAFAMGLRTAEKFLTTSSMKELQETPPV